MTADRTKTGPESGEAQPGGAGPGGPPAADKTDRQADEPLSQSMADLSRRLGERAARQPEVDPGEAKAARRAALEAYDRARSRRLIVGLSLATAVVVAAGVAYLVPTLGLRAVPPSPSAEAQPAPAPPVEVATAAPAPSPPDSPAPSSPSPAASVPRHARRACGRASGTGGGQPTGTCSASSGGTVPATAVGKPRFHLVRHGDQDGTDPCDGPPTGICRAGAEPGPAAARRSKGSPGETAIVRLQSRTARRSPGGHDRRGRHALPAAQGPSADRHGRPSTAGAAPPGSRAPGCPARRKARRARDPFARSAALRSLRTRARRRQSPRPVAGLIDAVTRNQIFANTEHTLW